MFFFQRLKQWIGYENVTNEDLNAEFNNLIRSSGADTLGGANSTGNSTPTVLSMQSEENPGGLGSEVLSTTVQEDIKQLRYQLSLITGKTYWYIAPAESIDTIASQLNTLSPSPQFSIVSGRQDANGQPMFLIPDGTTNTIVLKASVTPFVCFIGGLQVTVSSDLTITGLTLAPSSNNTCKLADRWLDGSQGSKWQGERTSILQFNQPGTAITALANTWQSFKTGAEYFIGKINYLDTTNAATFTNATPTVVSTTSHGLSEDDQVSFSGGSLPTGITANLPYFVHVIDSNSYSLSSAAGNAMPVATSSTGSGTALYLSTTSLNSVFRGWFFDHTDSPIVPVAVTSADTVTLMKTAWIFLTNNGSPATPALDVTYNKPTYAFAAPTSPNSGDYWFDITNNTWKKYSGSAFAATNALLIGICIQNGTATAGARSFDFSKSFSLTNTFRPYKYDNSNFIGKSLSERVSVYGVTVALNQDIPVWNTTNNMDIGLTFTANTTYFLYVTPLGNLLISDRAPNDRKSDLRGDYHPHKPYRCVGFLINPLSGPVGPVSFSEFYETALPEAMIAEVNFPYLNAHNSAGQISSGGVSTRAIANGAVTGPKKATLSFAISSSSGTFTTTSTTLTQVTNFSITLVTTGRPVFIFVQSDGLSVTNAGCVNCTAATATEAGAFFVIDRDAATAVYPTKLDFAPGSSTISDTITVPPGAVCAIDFPGAGSHTYILNAKVLGASMTAGVLNCVMVAYEL